MSPSTMKGGFLRDDATGALAISAPQYAGDDGQAGFIAPTARAWFESNRVCAANRAYFGRFWLPRAVNLVSVGFNVVTVDAGNPTMDVGIYTPNGTALARVATYSNQTGGGSGIAGKGTVAGWQTIALTASLVPGQVYYYGISSSSAVLALAAATFGNGADILAFGATVPQAMGMLADTAHPLPAAPSAFSFAAQNSFPYVTLRES